MNKYTRIYTEGLQKNAGPFGTAAKWVGKKIIGNPDDAGLAVGKYKELMEVRRLGEANANAQGYKLVTLQQPYDPRTMIGRANEQAKERGGMINGLYSPSQQRIEINMLASPDATRKARRHEMGHFYQDIGRERRLLPGSSIVGSSFDHPKPTAISQISNAIKTVSAEGQARVIETNSTIHGIKDLYRNSNLYAESARTHGLPYEEAAYKTINKAPQIAQYTAAGLASAGVGIGAASAVDKPTIQAIRRNPTQYIKQKAQQYLTPTTQQRP